jgi:exodeoxyribonuclease VII small subunit
MTAKRVTETFEESYARLEQTVEKLEKGGLSLEESIALYEEGMELAKRCQTMLDDAELRITKLRESFAEPAPQPVAANGGDPSFGEDIPFEEEEPSAFEE